MAVFSFPVPKRFHPPDSRSLLGERPPSFQRSEAGRLGSVWTAGPVGTPGGSFHGFHVRVWKAARRRDLQNFSGERRKSRGNLPVFPQKANRTTSLPGGGPQAVTKSKDFSDSLQKCRYFCAAFQRRRTVSVFLFKIRVRLNPILPRFHGPDAGSLFQFSAQQRQAGHDARSFSARRGASRPTGPAYHRGLVLFSYNRPPGEFFQKIWPGGHSLRAQLIKKPV